MTPADVQSLERELLKRMDIIVAKKRKLALLRRGGSQQLGRTQMAAEALAELGRVPDATGRSTVAPLTLSHLVPGAADAHRPRMA